MRLMSHSPAQTRRIARKVLTSLFRRTVRPPILALAGELGSGKTTFIQGLARGLGIRNKVQSPTFVLMKRYRLPTMRYPFRHLIHIDAYRLTGRSAARHLGLAGVFRERGAIIVIEWTDRIRKLIPKNAIWISLHHGRLPHERIVELKAQSPKRKTTAQSAKRRKF